MLHLPSFLIHAMTQPLPHAREMLRAPAGSRLILLGCSAAAPRAVPSERDERTGVGTRSWLIAGLAGGSWLQPLAHHCSSPSSSMGRRPRRVRAHLLPQPRDLPRKVAAPICGNGFLIRPLVGLESEGVGGARSEKRRGKGERRRRRKERGSWPSRCRGSSEQDELQQVHWHRSHALASLSPCFPPPLGGPTLYLLPSPTPNSADQTLTHAHTRTNAHSLALPQLCAVLLESRLRAASSKQRKFNLLVRAEAASAVGGERQRGLLRDLLCSC